MFYEEQKPHRSSTFDGFSSLSLLTCAQTGVPSWFDLSVVAGDESQQGEIFVVDVIDVIEGFASRFFGHGFSWLIVLLTVNGLRLSALDP